ncbi:unnamed protein product [Ilex paraguariensis]|uniref:Organ specific protein n=1 Tax=Ilex paraguariensis TaxID=185542 RepID=A0ABC8RHR7_9AQUA
MNSLTFSQSLCFNKLEDMRSFPAFILLLSLFLFANLSNARKEPGEYWNSIMNGEPMPKAIKDLLLHQDPASQSTTSETMNLKPFIRDFDSRPSVIIYHTHIRTPRRVVKPSQMTINPLLD